MKYDTLPWFYKLGISKEFYLPTITVHDDFISECRGANVKHSNELMAEVMKSTKTRIKVPLSRTLSNTFGYNNTFVKDTRYPAYIYFLDIPRLVNTSSKTCVVCQEEPNVVPYCYKCYKTGSVVQVNWARAYAATCSMKLLFDTLYASEKSLREKSSKRSGLGNSQQVSVVVGSCPSKKFFKISGVFSSSFVHATQTKDVKNLKLVYEAMASAMSIMLNISGVNRKAMQILMNDYFSCYFTYSGKVVIRTFGSKAEIRPLTTSKMDKDGIYAFESTELKSPLELITLFAGLCAVCKLYEW